MLWLAVLLLALLYTHGVSGESAAHHSAPGVTMSATSATPESHEHAPPHHHDDDGTGHASDHCVSGQPPQGADLPSPCPTPFVIASFPHARTITHSRATEAGITSAERRDPAILRV